MTASTSPKRRAPAEWDVLRTQDTCARTKGATKAPKRKGTTRSLSPRRNGTEPRKDDRNGMQSYIHQFMITKTTAPKCGREENGEVEGKSHPGTHEQAEVQAQPDKTATNQVEQHREGKDKEAGDCQFIGVTKAEDNGCSLTTWLAMLGGKTTDVPATRQCGWIAFLCGATKCNTRDHTTDYRGRTGSKQTKKQVLNGMIANLADEARLHPADMKAEIVNRGQEAAMEHRTQAEQIRGSANHYVLQRN